VSFMRSQEKQKNHQKNRQVFFYLFSIGSG